MTVLPLGYARRPVSSRRRQSVADHDVVETMLLWQVGHGVHWRRVGWVTRKVRRRGRRRGTTATRCRGHCHLGSEPFLVVAVVVELTLEDGVCDRQLAQHVVVGHGWRTGKVARPLPAVVNVDQTSAVVEPEFEMAVIAI